MWLDSGQTFLLDVAFGPVEYALPFLNYHPIPGQSYKSSDGVTYTDWAPDREIAIRARVMYCNDDDLDELCAVYDNCPNVYNPDQTDTDGDGIGDVCNGCCIDIRGNVDYDPGDVIDISDLVYLVDYMFSGGPEPPCPEEADIDGSGGIDISDLVYLVDYMFSGGPPPVACP